MKRILTLFSALFLALAAFAQTPEEIVNKMEETETQLKKGDGSVVTIEAKYPIIGKVTNKIWSRGNKVRFELEMFKHKGITFSDGKTEWYYSPEENQVKIRRSDSGKEPKEVPSIVRKFADFDGNSAFENIVDGYDISLEKETATAWYLHCKRKKSNKEKDAPKNMDLVIAKGSYRLLSQSVEMAGVSLKYSGFDYNVTEKQVTFDPADYPGVTIIDER
jgi:outer membrane lipoprotein-sorting protein